MDAVKKPTHLLTIEKELDGPGREEALARYDAVLAALRDVIAEEDPGKPLSDEKISERLQEEGFPVARRTVAKYRDKLGIPGAFERGLARSAR